MVDVVYLYHHQPAAWEELRYSIRSLEKHLKEDYRLIIIGEVLPPWIQNVAWVYSKHTGGSRYLDVSRKVEFVANCPAIREKVLFMYDDVYLIDDVKDCSVFDGHLYQVPLADKVSSSHQYWYELLKRTMVFLAKHKAPTYNMETHLPRYFHKAIIKIAFNQIPIIYHNLQRWTALGNWQRDLLSIKTEPLQAKEIKAGFYGAASDQSESANNLKQIEAACKGKIVLNHNDYGLTGAMKQFLKERFPTPSKYERF